MVVRVTCALRSVDGAGVLVFSLIGLDAVSVLGREAELHLCIPSPDSSPRRARLLGCAMLLCSPCRERICRAGRCPVGVLAV
jgi:hypothetical protein